jgi:hypothetical protein
MQAEPFGPIAGIVPLPIDPAADPLWCDMLADKLTEREYWAIFARDVGGRLGEAWTPADFLRVARSPDLNDEIRPEIVDLVHRAKRHGCRPCHPVQ